MMKLLFACLFALTSIFSILGAPFADFGGTEPQFRNFTTAEGLPSNRVRDVAQDSVGFVWFATDGGVVRFDGVRFKRYRLVPDSEGAEVEPEERFALKLLAAGASLYVGTDSHVYRYEPESDTFRQVSLLDASGKPASGLIRSMAVDHKGQLWVSIAGKGVWGGGEHYSLPDLQVFNAVLFVDSHARVWVASNSGAGNLFLLNPSTKRFEPVALTLPDGSAVDCRAFAMGESASGQLWVALWNGDLLKVNPLTGEAHKIGHTGAFHTRSLLILPSDHGERLLLGSDTGLTQVETSADPSATTPRLARTLVPDELNPRSLTGNFVYGLIRDREGGYWITTYHNGVSYLPPASRSFTAFRPSAFRNSVKGKLVSAITSTPDNQMYFGSEDGGLSLFSPVDDKFYLPYQKAPAPSPDLDIHALHFNHPYLWIGTYARGVYRLDCRDGSIKAFPYAPVEAGQPQENSCYALTTTSDGTLWGATPYSLCRYDADKEQFVYVRPLEATTSNMVEDTRGNLWLSTNGRGVLRFNPAKDVWKQYRQSSSGLPHDHVNFLTVTKNGEIWAATVDGLARYDSKTDDFTAVPLPPDVPSEMTAVIEADGILWISTTNGLLRYDPANGACRICTVDDGLPSNSFLQASCGIAPDGRVYFGTANGFVAFYPRQLDQAPFAAPLVFTDVEVNGRERLLPGDVRLPQPLASGASLRIGPDEKSVAVEFASLAYSNAHSARYRYRLDGFDNDWVEADAHGRAVYTSLPAGRYTLRVQSADSSVADGWNPDTLTLYVSVAPPWYASWWMITLYVMLVVGLVAALVFYIVYRAATRHKAEIARLRASREKEIQEAKMQFFTIVAHEIRTPVSLIIGPLEKAQKLLAASPAAHDLAIIDRNAQRLLSLVNQLLDFKKAEQTIFSYSYTPTSVIAQAETVAPRFRPALEEVGVTFVCKYPTEDFKADIDPEAFNKLLSNLLNNARKFTHSRVELEITVDHQEGSFSISVSDDGKGIPGDMRKKIFKPFYQVHGGSTSQRSDTSQGTGLGLSIVKRIVTAHGGKIAVESSTTAPTFTTFTITLPLHQAPTATTPKTASSLAAAPESSGEQTDKNVPLKEDKPATGAKEGSANEGTAAQSKPSILVVDDNPEMTSFLAESLGEDFSVVTAADGAEALGIIKASSPEEGFALIVSDWMMPGMSGIDLCKTLRSDQNTSHLPFILLTAKTDNLSKVEAMDCGADYFIEKPFSTDFLRACIANLAGRRRQAAARFATEPLTPVQTVATSVVDASFMERLTAIIEEHFADPDLNVAQLASLMAMSRSTFYAKIKTLAEITPNELIELTRLKRAASLLTSGGYLVGEVATLVGFNSSSYFAQRFKAQFGMTPAAFVAQAKK